MENDKIIQWLLAGDVSIQYQVSRDILKRNATTLSTLQKKIETEGWGLKLLKKQHPNGHWGRTFYQPKWTSTHYTLTDLKIIGLPPENKAAQRSTEMVLSQPQGKFGGINYSVTVKESDVCINGMILNFAAYFLPQHSRLPNIIDYLLNVQLLDGGWNCNYLKKDTAHSSLHSTLSVLEGLLEFRKNIPDYRPLEILQAEKRAISFLLLHNLYQSHHTGETIDLRMLRLSFPSRWRYDILRALDYFQMANVPYDKGMKSALEILVAKKGKDGKWPLQEKHKGEVHFDMEKIGEPSRWNTLRALRVLNYYL
jgi:hypothetical protein